MPPRKLRNSITSDEYLQKWCAKYVPGFYGVYSASEFPRIYRHMKPGNSVIINLDPHYEHGGTHWVALRVCSTAPIVMYKDSFGAPPPNAIKTAVAASDRGLVYGNRIYQALDEENCGKRAAEFLYDLSEAADEISLFERMEN